MNSGNLGLSVGPQVVQVAGNMTGFKWEFRLPTSQQMSEVELFLSDQTETLASAWKHGEMIRGRKRFLRNTLLLCYSKQSLGLIVGFLAAAVRSDLKHPFCVRVQTDRFRGCGLWSKIIWFQVTCYCLYLDGPLRPHTVMEVAKSSICD